MINLHRMDCMTAMAEMEDNAFDLAIVDPPYGIGVGRMGYTQAEGRCVKQSSGKLIQVKTLGYKHGEWDNSTPNDLYFKELFRVSKKQIIWGVNYMPVVLSGGRIIWDKCVPDGVSFSDCEIAYCSEIVGIKMFTYMWSGMMQAKSLSDPSTQQGNKKLNEKRIHPTQKPAALYQWLLKNYAKQGDKILDTHLGSGSIALACHDMDFDLEGYEIDEEYYNGAVKRLEKHQQQIRMF